MIEVRVRNAALEPVEHVESFTSLELVERHLGVGNWSLSMAVRDERGDVQPSVRALIGETDAGIEVLEDGQALFGGPVREVSRERGAQDRVTFSGFDDNVWLEDRIAAPQPLTADPASWTTAYDVHTGVATTALRAFVNVQAGPGALAARRVPRMMLAADPVQGTSDTIRGRFGSVLAAYHPFAVKHDLAVFVRQVGGDLVFTARKNRLQDSVVFAPDWGSLDSWSYKLSGPEATAVYVTGQGDLGTRMIRQVTQTPPARWGRRVERTLDQRNLATAAELIDAGTTYLVENGPVSSLAVTASGGEFRYRRDFDLGDRCRVVVDGLEWTDQVTEVTTTATASGVSHAITVGGVQEDAVAILFRHLESHGARMNRLEAR